MNRHNHSVGNRLTMALLALGFSATVLLATVSPAHSHCKLAEPAEFTPRSVLA